MRTMYLLAIVVLPAALPCAAQGMGTTAGCNLSGVWYGGSPDAPSPYYKGTILPISADRFSITFELLPEIQSAGYLHATTWSGEVSKSGPHTYSGMAFSMWQIDPNFKPDPPVPPYLPGVDPSLPELDYIHIKSLEFTDCDTIKFTYDIWVTYMNYTYDIKPLVDIPSPPGSIWVIDPVLEEVYHRMTTAVPAAFYSGAMASGTQAAGKDKAAKPPFKLKK